MKKGTRSEKNFNEIFPTEIVSEILTCLPTESVLECKLVCKTWKNLIHHPSFSQRHLARLNSADSGKLRYIALDLDYSSGYYDGFKFYYFEYKDDEDWNYVKPRHREIMLKTTPKDYILIGSFNGLICVYGFDTDLSEVWGLHVIIFNPVVKEYVVLPYQFDSFQEHGHLACGFGYLAKTNEYKVVRLFWHLRELNVVKVEVYTVGSGKGWRYVGKFDLAFCPPYHQEHGVFWNGALHWRNTQGGIVVVFDLAREKFREHIPPPPLQTGTNDGLIGVSGGGILYYAALHQSIEKCEPGDVWLLMKKNDGHVMKEELEHQSWGWIKPASLGQREPFAFMEGGTVLRYDQGKLKIFLSSTSTWENLADFGEMACQVFPYKPSLISLKELGEKNVERMTSRGIEEADRSDFSSDESWSD